jgi:peptidoglycan/LPS O-acetylase OafA/YrhL
MTSTSARPHIDGLKPRADWYRPDITGLRTLAIVPVVAFHAGASFMPGGFIGVDVFFVISGFLITTLLVRELELTGRISLSQFWAKRIRRLVPALTVMVAITLPFAALISSILAWDDLAAQAAASAAYVSNVYFWARQDSYFDTGSAASPYLHMWSLGVEEQFYLFWPLLLLVFAFAMRKVVSPRIALSVGISSLVVLSFAACVVITPLSQNSAFYLLPTRAWEFGVGALLALAPLAKWIKARSFATALSLAGVILLVCGVTLMNEGSSFPGWSALVPVLATALLIAGGVTSNAFRPLLEVRGMVWIGKVSYSWYLWHWPLAVFAVVLFPESQWALTVSALVALAIAEASRRLVEDPFRTNRYFAATTRRAYALAAIATGVSIAIAAIVFSAGQVIERTPAFSAYSMAATSVPDHSCTEQQATDAGSLCIIGDPAGKTTVALIGDSHAGHWKHALDLAGQELGLRVIVRWKSACPSIPVNIVSASGQSRDACDEFQRETMDLIEAARPDLVIISNAGGYLEGIRGQGAQEITIPERAAAWGRALRGQVENLTRIGARVTIFDDNPRMHFNPTGCLTTIWRIAESCDSSRDKGLDLIEDLVGESRAVSEDLGLGHMFSVTDEICSASTCSAQNESGIPIYQDQTHISRVWSETQVGRLKEFLHSYDLQR